MIHMQEGTAQQMCCIYYSPSPSLLRDWSRCSIFRFHSRPKYSSLYCRNLSYRVGSSALAYPKCFRSCLHHPHSDIFKILRSWCIPVWSFGISSSEYFIFLNVCGSHRILHMSLEFPLVSLFPTREGKGTPTWRYPRPSSQAFEQFSGLLSLEWVNVILAIQCIRKILDRPTAQR